MSSCVTSFLVEYDPINKSNIFASGDFIHGKITLELSKDCKVQLLYVKLKGKAEVLFFEQYYSETEIYYSENKFFSIKQILIQESQGNDILRKGTHVFPFTFQIPARELPSSFKGQHGKIKYTLEAKLRSPMCKDRKAKAEFTLIHKENLNSHPALMASQHDITDKKLKLFNLGAVGIDVNIERTGFYKGEGVKVVASIRNRSSRNVRPKYSLYSKHSYFADGHRKVRTKEILKEVGDPIPPSGGQTVTRIITIPPSVSVSVMNCSIISVEYRLKVHLDVKYAFGPVLKFPIILLPATERTEPEQHTPIVNGFETLSNAGFRGSSVFQKPDGSFPSPPPLTYDSYRMYPSLSEIQSSAL